MDSVKDFFRRLWQAIIDFFSQDHIKEWFAANSAELANTMMKVAFAV